MAKAISGPKKYHTECRDCGATIEYTADDVESVWSTDYTGSKDLMYFIRCPRPECKQRIFVKRPGL